MSRSYKKFAICTEQKRQRFFFKRKASKKFRRENIDGCIKGNYYKKVYDSYKIKDYYFLETKEHFINFYTTILNYTVEESKNLYDKIYLRK